MKPVKRVLSKEQPLNYLQYDKGYNHCFDDYETYLKSEGVKIVEEVIYSLKNNSGELSAVAQAIYKAIGGGI